MFIHRLKKNQRKKANFNCKWRISLLIEHALIIWDKIKILQVRQQATQKNKQEKWKIWTTFYSCYDDWFFDSCPVEVNRPYHSCFVRSQQIFTHSLRLFLHGTSLLLACVAYPIRRLLRRLVCFYQKCCKPCQWSHDLCDRSGISSTTPMIPCNE